MGVRLSSGGIGGVLLAVGGAVVVGEIVVFVMAQPITKIERVPNSITRTDLIAPTFFRARV
jgi:hypothetical protein